MAKITGASKCGRRAIAEPTEIIVGLGITEYQKTIRPQALSMIKGLLSGTLLISAVGILAYLLLFVFMLFI